MKVFLTLILTLSTLNLMCQLPDYISTFGLVAWYDLAGGGEDGSGNDNDGVVFGAIPAEDHLGNDLGAMFFENSAIEIATTENFDLNSFTVSAWFKTTNKATGYQSIFSHFMQSDDNGYYGYWLGLLGENGDLFLGANSWTDVTNSTPLNDGEWHMIAGVYNYANASLYVDGELVNTAAFGMSLLNPELRLGMIFLMSHFLGHLTMLEFGTVRFWLVR